MWLVPVLYIYAYAWGGLASAAPVDKFSVLRDLLQYLDLILNRENEVETEKRFLSDQYQDSEVDDNFIFGQLIEDPALKRAPPGGFTAARGKRGQGDIQNNYSDNEGMSDAELHQRFIDGLQYLTSRKKKSYDDVKRFPSNSDFLGVRGKKSYSDPFKRAPSEADFFSVRGKKSYENEKRVPLPGDFYGARGKKDSYKRIPKPGEFFGARGKRGDFDAYDEEIKRTLANNFFGARGKRDNDGDIDDWKRTLGNGFVGVRGKRSIHTHQENSPLNRDITHFEKYEK